MDKGLCNLHLPERRVFAASLLKKENPIKFEVIPPSELESGQYLAHND